MSLPVHIVVPVYRGIELTRRCLESLAASGLPSDCRITLINDASPETGMDEMLVAFVEEVTFSGLSRGAGVDRPAWELLRNTVNLGFVASVNRGMARWPEHDVVLLNNDTEVPSGWLQRLRSAAYRGGRTGTVTPFSNCGSLASYPKPNVENALPANLSPDRLDRFFGIANAEATVDIPIGVGFCLFIRRDCLKDTGAFDEETFGKGYGEENDFCLRAAQRGWAHVLAADCFVYHRGHGSFGHEKAVRVRQAYGLLAERYPHYPALIQRHFAVDPARPFRLRTDLVRLANGTPSVRLVVGVALPAADRPGHDETVPLLHLSGGRSGYFILQWLNEGEAFKLWFRLPGEWENLRELLLAIPIADVRGNDPPWLVQELSALTGVSGRVPVSARSLDLVALHGLPRFRGWAAVRQTLATLVQRSAGSRLLSPFVAALPEAVRERLRHWVRTNRA
ncbi:glycosyltransferase family 2 protein [Pseudothauera rhizosphaerae]|uniref:Glycosyltransferase n=1 Tax=Pseudothauera rhizosphaerae TaxID=2565932 RepID=A0A4V3W9Q4_9RHOO|nr:glycosyltransferase [Pseudothauera rhizosphaerae]THF56184.1 glycosyltransferase [Pseudothauera rhizosphaerae]